MQTFLPYSDFQRCASVLDNKRLGKQRVECLQILTVLSKDGKIAWMNHPAVKMWRGCEWALYAYMARICYEWEGKRGFKDTCFNKASVVMTNTKLKNGDVTCYPKWLGDERLHSSHRAALLHKLPSHYNQFGWTETPKLDYWWPTKSTV